ncbi:MAG: histidine kinase N-terminal 7TM domain-containing protein [Anaerovorax sp.]|nr:histidine kinase N-terminal 7TM domain-containing protein [Anaerovorax sp.]
MSNVILSSLLMVSSILLCILALYGIKNKEIPGALYFSLLMLAMAVHSIGYSFELQGNTIEQMYYFIRIEYIGTSFYPTLILLFAREYIDEKKVANKCVITLLFMINVFTFIFVNTNSYHFLYYSSIALDFSLGFPIMILNKGIWYIVQTISLYFSLFYSVIFFFIRYKKSTGYYRKRIAFMLIGTIIPFITFFIYMLRAIYIDVSPFSYLVMSLFIFHGFLRYRSLSFMPVTYEMIFNSVEEAVLVIDNEKLLVRFNRASELLFPSLSERKLGEPIHFVTELQGYDFYTNPKIYKVDERILNFKTVNIGNNKGYIYVVSDITETEQYKKHLEILATKDALTGLYNRRYFMDTLYADHKEGIFVMIDIDHFKNINDTFGHTQGDHVLADFSNQLMQSFPEQPVYRYGGEEFAMFFESKSLDYVYEKIEAFRKEIEKQNNNIIYTFSAGLALYTNGNVLKAINQADKMLYEGKKTGRNQIMY